MTPTEISFFVHGDPATAGSKSAKRGFNGRIQLVDSSGQRGKDWRSDVRAAALSRYQDKPFEGPLFLGVKFRMRRPKNHSGKNGLKDNAPTHHTKRPDATKMLRAVEDALNGILWLDDSQIAHQEVSKVYADQPGAHVVVRKMEENGC